LVGSSSFGEIGKVRISLWWTTRQQFLDDYWFSENPRIE
jgi:hypothetical protein